MPAGSAFRRRRGAGRQRLSERLERIEDADRELEAAEVTRRVVDLRQPVRVDVAQANRSERGVGRRGVVAVARAHAGQRHVIQDRIGAEQADVSAHQELAHVVVAERQENLPHVDARAPERRVRLARALLQVRTAVVGADPGIEAEGHGDVVAALRRRRTEGQCGGKQAVADGRSAVFARAAAARKSPRDCRRRFVLTTRADVVDIHVAVGRELPVAGRHLHGRRGCCSAQLSRAQMRIPIAVSFC